MKDVRAGELPALFVSARKGGNMAEYYSTADLARWLRVSPSAVREALRAGRAPEPEIRSPTMARMFSKSEAEEVYRRLKRD